MTTDQIIFAGVELSSGRKPVTFAALDDDLKIESVEKWDVSEALTSLKSYKSIWLALSIHSREKQTDQDFEEALLHAGFTPYSGKTDPKQLLLTNAQDCFRAFIERKAFPRGGLEGRLQRSAVLFEQGLQMKDPIDVFEEITLYKLIHGILPLEGIYSSKELDALMAAYLAWLAVKRPGQIVLTGEFALPVKE
jgi:hypothetical protein